MWVGLDNAIPDLYQSGSASECFLGFNISSDDQNWVEYTFSNYYMWLECLPFAEWAVPRYNCRIHTRTSFSGGYSAAACAVSMVGTNIEGQPDLGAIAIPVPGGQAASLLWLWLGYGTWYWEASPPVTA
jgi:hypothetical protein